MNWQYVNNMFVFLIQKMKNMRLRMDDPELLYPDIVINMLLAYRKIQVSLKTKFAIFYSIIFRCILAENKLEDI